MSAAGDEIRSDGAFDDAWSQVAEPIAELSKNLESFEREREKALATLQKSRDRAWDRIVDNPKNIYNLRPGLSDEEVLRRIERKDRKLEKVRSRQLPRCGYAPRLYVRFIPIGMSKNEYLDWWADRCSSRTRRRTKRTLPRWVKSGWRPYSAMSRKLEKALAAYHTMDRAWTRLHEHSEKRFNREFESRVEAKLGINVDTNDLSGRAQLVEALARSTSYRDVMSRRIGPTETDDREPLTVRRLLLDECVARQCVVRRLASYSADAAARTLAPIHENLVRSVLLRPLTIALSITSLLGNAVWLLLSLAATSITCPPSCLRDRKRILGTGFSGTTATRGSSRSNPW